MEFAVRTCFSFCCIPFQKHASVYFGTGRTINTATLREKQQFHLSHPFSLFCTCLEQGLLQFSARHSIFVSTLTLNPSHETMGGFPPTLPGRVAQSVGHLTRKSGVLGSIPGLATYFRFSFRFFKKGSCQLLAKGARSTG